MAKAMIRESAFMRELEEWRAAHAKNLEGLTAAEKARVCEEAGERAYKELGLTIPKMDRTRKVAA